MCTGLWCTYNTRIGVGHTALCDSVLEHTHGALRDSTLKGECSTHTHPIVLPTSQLGAAYGNCRLKHVGQQTCKWKQYCSLEQPPQHHKLARGDRQSENHKNFKTLSDALAWPNHSTEERQSYKAVLPFAPGHTKSKCWAETSGDLGHVTFHLEISTHPALP